MKAGTNIKRLADEAAEITAFCLENRGRCFPGWSDKKVFAYVVFQLTARTCVVTRFSNGTVAGVAFVWPDIAAKVRERAAKDEPQFRWTIPTSEGDCLFIAEIIAGTAGAQGGLAVSLMALWYRDMKCAEFETWPKFTYRRGQLVELSNEKIARFMAHSGIGKERH